MGNAEAELSVSGMYCRGEGVAKNYDQSLYWEQRAADQNSPRALFWLGNSYSGGGFCGARFPVDLQKAFSLLLRAADQGYAPAESQVGWRLRDGWGVTKSTEMALYWLEKARAQNEPNSYAPLARMYRDGNGVPQNIPLARSYYQKAIALGNGYLQPELDALNASQQTDSSSAATTSNTVKTQATYGQSGGQNAASQGTCAVVYEAQTEHTEMYGTYLTYGAAWGRATIGEAQNAARADLFRSLGNTPINHTLLGANSDGMVTDASGCGHDHGAVAVALKETFIDGRLHTFGNVVFEQVDAALADSTEAASAQAIAACKAEYNGSYQDFLNCHVVVRW